MFKKFLPQETSFFDYFEQHGALASAVCRELLVLTSGEADIATQAARIKEIEKQADTITRKCIEALHKTFITPVDRADIHVLMKRLDDIVDTVESAATRMALYEIKEMRPEARRLAEVLVKATIEIEAALKHLRNLKNTEEIQRHCVAVYTLENEGDAILREALVRLFRETDAILVIKWKEIYERLEKATDRCESVASAIQGIVIEAS
jgi:uncharacterized protein